MDVPQVSRCRRKSPPRSQVTRGSQCGDRAVWPAWQPLEGPGFSSLGKGSLMNEPESLLRRVHQPSDLKGLNEAELAQLAAEMRAELIAVLSRRSAHFASNLGVVELCLALHLTFDFTQDRLIWDTGHQIYPHKLITGRADRLHTIRTKGGLMGYPNPSESPFDLFMTGHAGCAPSTALGLA